MYFIPVLSVDSEINAKIDSSCKRIADFESVIIEGYDSFIHYLNYEIPEIEILHYPNPDFDRVVDAIRSDPWLHYGGLIIIYEGIVEQKLSKALSGVNVIALIHRNRLDMYLPRVMELIQTNRNILFHRDMHVLMQSNLTGTIELDNDPFDAAVYSNLIANFLYNSNLLNVESRDQFYSAIMELLINGIEHGNCEITHEEKRRYLTENSDLLGLIASKSENSEIANRKVKLDYQITPARSVFKITDEGPGFNWQEFTAKDSDESVPPEDALHGRGILMARHFLRELQYHGRGNEVSFQLQHLVAESNTIPGFFHDQQEVLFDDGEIVFEQGDTSSHLYYIISGRFEIIANDKVVSTLTPADIFLGEMSFLLNNRRSATVKAQGWCKCIKVSKEAFINSIKEHPHYGIFLARLLAQRLGQLHQITI